MTTKKKKVIQIIRWKCPVCKKEYENKKDADDCFAIPSIKLFKVGDVVIPNKYYKMGWFDGDPKWVVNIDEYKRDNPNNLPGIVKIGFYYIITAITKSEHNPHQINYHMETLAMTGNQGYRQCYNFISEYTGKLYCDMIKVENPPQYILDKIKSLKGHKADEGMWM
jgi:hypothetical protein